MSDEQGSTPKHPHEETGPPPAHDEATVPVIPSVTPSDPFATQAALPPAPSRRPAAYAAVVVGLLALIGGAVYLATSLGGSASSKGTKTPEAAVQRLFDALGNQDMIGVLESLTPSERDVLTGRIKTITSELGRLGILRKDVNLNGVQGIDINFTGLKFATETLAPGYSTVNVTAGRASYRIDPGSSTLGDFVRSRMPATSGQVLTGSQDLAPQKGFLVAKLENGGWYVSLFYSAAESARRDAQAPLPPFGSGVAARGASSPEAAVDGFFRAIAGLDIRRIVELTPPDEAAVLHDYAPLFLSEAESAAAGARKHFTVAIRALDFSSTTSGDEAVVRIKKIAFKLTIPSIGLSLESDGRCVTFTGGEIFGGTKPQRTCGATGGSVAGLPGLGKPDIGFVAVRRGGSWYVSPTRSILDALIGVMKSLKPGDLQSLQQLFGVFSREATGGGFPTSIPFPLPS